MLALVLGLGSSLCWGVSDFMGGHQARAVSTAFVLAVSQAFGLVAFLVVLLASGHSGPGAATLPAIGAGVSGGLGLACFYRALAIGRMSTVAPIVATSTLLPIAAGLMRGERLHALASAGVALAIFGVVITTRTEGEGTNGTAQANTRLSLLLAGLAALGTGSALVLLGRAAAHDLLWTLVLARAASVAGALVFLFASRPVTPPSIHRFGAVLLVGALEASAVALYSLGTTRGLLSITAVASSLYPVVTVFLARALLDERVRKVQALAAAITLLGVVLMGTQ